MTVYQNSIEEVSKKKKAKTNHINNERRSLLFFSNNAFLFINICIKLMKLRFTDAKEETREAIEKEEEAENK